MMVSGHLIIGGWNAAKTEGTFHSNISRAGKHKFPVWLERNLDLFTFLRA